MNVTLIAPSDDAVFWGATTGVVVGAAVGAGVAGGAWVVHATNSITKKIPITLLKLLVFLFIVYLFFENWFYE
jgi:hypothetical protein